MNNKPRVSVINRLLVRYFYSMCDLVYSTVKIEIMNMLRVRSKLTLNISEQAPLKLARQFQTNKRASP